MNKSKHYITTLVGAIVLVWAFTASSRAQKYSDWSAPINLGPTVNSTAMDRGPAISKDGLSLYFASNGWAVSAEKTSMSLSARPATMSGVRPLIWDRLSIRPLTRWSRRSRAMATCCFLLLIGP